MKSVPSVQDRGIMVPMSWGFLTAAMVTPDAAFCAWNGALLLSFKVTSFELPTVCLAGDEPAKADSPGIDGTVKAAAR